MTKGRLEAFSDGVIAIIITIMVLELKVPHGTELSALKPLIPVIMSYILSFAYLGIYWNNHHHMLAVTKHIDGGVLWANLFLLFWLSLIPFTTGWMGEHYTSAMPVALYGVVLFMAAISFVILQQKLLRKHGEDSLFAKAAGDNLKGKISIVMYLAAIILSFVNVIIAQILYFLVALMWVIPGRRIERIIEKSEE
ncbi:MAG TPA: TMEM175 family protein [Bacteroidales bacterium]